MTLLMSRFLSAEADAAATANKHVTFCAGTETIDLYPFLPMDDARRIPLLSLVARSYISKNQAEPGILEKWSFSEDGKTLTAKVALDAKWQDGTPVSAKEAAFGIAKGLTHRELGEKLRVAGTEGINSAGWQDKTYSGIQLLTADTFELKFEGNIRNIAGVVREALSTGSRHNRLWPARLTKIKNDSYGTDFDLVSKFPLVREGAKYIAKVKNQSVELLPSGQCKSADLNQFVQFIADDLSNYTTSESHSKQSLIAVVNPASKNFAQRDERLLLAGMLKEGLNDVERPYPVQKVQSHFLEREAGGGTGIAWDLKSAKAIKGKIKELKIIPGNKNFPKNVYGKAIAKVAEQYGIKIEWLAPDAKLATADVFITPTRIEEGRQIWLQDLTSDPSLTESLAGYSKTNAALNEVRAKSSSTIPTDNVTLQALEKAAFEEASIIPVARFGLILFSKRTSPVELVWTEQDELNFRLREANL